MINLKLFLINNMHKMLRKSKTIMSIRSITFIENPPYIVDFSQFSQKKNKLEKFDNLQKVQATASFGLKLIKTFFTSVWEATHLTISTAGDSFKHTVFGRHGNRMWNMGRSDYRKLIGLKVINWVFGMGWYFTSTTTRLLYEQWSDPSSDKPFLSQFAGDEIDVSHLQTRQLSIDVSKVPQEIVIDQLFDLFDQINFEDSKAPGYMAPLSRQEWKVTYSQAQLRESLETFVNHVKGRVAFVGTPPNYDMPRLMAFYQQIEDAVRFCIHKVQSDLVEFHQANGMDPASFQGANLNRYNDLLENRSRVALNLAIAGSHCGARYLGEAMELYDEVNGESSMVQSTLKESLIELLAIKRREIARKQILTYLGNDTHKYNLYMASLGKILAIPGTENVIEHLTSGFDHFRFLKLFFKEYTVDFIIASVQNKLKRSQIFREKFTDWLSDQVEDWNQESETALEVTLEQAYPILARNQIAEDSPSYRSFCQLGSLISHLKGCQVEIPETESFDFICDLFAADVAKNWCRENLSKDPRYPNLPSALKGARLIQDMKSLFSEEQLGETLFKKVKELLSREEMQELKLTDFSQQLLSMQKAAEIQSITQLPLHTSLRVVNGKKDLKEALLDHRDLDRRSEFLSKLDLSRVDQDGLTPAMLEWILVSQNILLPQEI